MKSQNASVRGSHIGNAHLGPFGRATQQSVTERCGGHRNSRSQKSKHIMRTITLFLLICTAICRADLTTGLVGSRSRVELPIHPCSNAQETRTGGVRQFTFIAPPQ